MTVDFEESLGAACARAGLLSADELDRAWQLARGSGCSLQVAVQKVKPEITKHLPAILEEVTGSTALDPSRMHLTEDFVGRVLRILPSNVLVACRCFPIQLEGNSLHVALSDPSSRDTLDRLEGLSGMEIVPHVSPERGIADVLETRYPEDIRALRARSGTAEIICDETFAGWLERDMREFIDDALAVFARAADVAETLHEPATIRLAHQILNRLVRAEASDIHFEPQEHELLIRARVDGVMSTHWTLPRFASAPLAARIKTMAHLDPDVVDRPLDGNIGYGVIYGRQVEFRVSSLPGLNGNKLVLRVLDRSKGLVPLPQLGFEEDAYAVARSNFESPHGLVLITGPTGSGKTTTLYAALDLLNDEKVNILTAEDPIESRIAGTTQVNCGEDGVSFADALRSFLRQDPDIIMVGEIRDAETATIALRAALTGHLVLSTLHTNDAAGTILRLTNMGLEPFLVAGALKMAVAQRLVRVLCSECRRAAEPNGTARGLFEQAGLPIPSEIFELGGCDRCRGSGYRGRMGLYEVLNVDETISRLIADSAPPSAIHDAGVAAGMRPLLADGLLKVSRGNTSLAELNRVLAED